jgi:branched-chain amino acid transport system permease protein
MLSLFALGFNLLFGYTGLLSFGHAAFYATGAYATGLILKNVTASLIPGVVGGTLAATLLALVIGFFCVRHTDIYFSMLTLAFGMMVYSIAWKWRDVTGGDDGLVGIPRAPLQVPGVFNLNMRAMPNYYYFVLVISILAILLLYTIIKSPFGLVLQGIRENPGRVEFAGIPIKKYRLIAFVISGFFAGLAGALLAPLENMVAPAAADWTKSSEPILASLLGGIYTFTGPIVGSALFILLKESIVRVTEYWLMVYGIILLVILLGLRGGIVGAISQIGRRKK